jgi:hypothetical protein
MTASQVAALEEMLPDKGLPALPDAKYANLQPPLTASPPQSRERSPAASPAGLDCTVRDDFAPLRNLRINARTELGRGAADGDETAICQLGAQRA